MALRASLLAVLLPLLGSCTGSRPVLTEREIAVHVGTVAVDPRTGSPLLVLQESKGARALPIWIGFAEATSIASEIERLRPPRPNSHDLVKRLVDGLQAQVSRVVVTEIRDGTYFAVLVLEARGRVVEIDARPSDAIAIALRVQAPLFVRESVFEAAEELPGGDAPSREAGRPAREPADRTGISSATPRAQATIPVTKRTRSVRFDGTSDARVLP